MNVFQRLALKAASITGAFDKIDDNKAYQSYQYTGGFNFNSFDDKYIIDKGYAGNADLYAIINKISQTAANIPLDLVEINKDGEEEVIKSGELYDLLQQPNRMQTMNEFVQEAIMFLLLSGNSYAAGYRSLGMGDQIREINNLGSQFVEIEGGDMTNPIEAYLYQEMYNIKFEANDVMHTRYPNPKGEGLDRLYGLSPLQAGNNALQSSNNTYDAKGNIIKNHGISGILTNKSERSLRAEDAKTMQESWDALSTNPKKYGRTLVTSADLDFIQMGLSPTDLQLIESGIIDLRTLCNIYSVPSQLFNDSQGTTFNNMAAAKKSLYTESVIPNLELWLGNFNNWFVNSWSVAENKEYCVKPNTSEIEVLQADKKIEAEKDKVNMEGVNVVLNMPIGNEAKIQILKENYDISTELSTILLVESTQGSTNGDSSNLESTPEAVDQNAIAQANLRGSVGGVQGILSIQQSVASGITSVNSAVTTLIEIYGFDNATARSILGV
jgi:HK97 family phage portal protein